MAAFKVSMAGRPEDLKWDVEVLYGTFFRELLVGQECD